MKRKVTSLLLMIGLISTLGLASCQNGNSTGTSTSVSTSTSTSTSVSTSNPSSSAENVAVKELTLDLSKTTAKIGETVTATVHVKPTNATNKEYTLSSSDTTLATISGDTITCVAKGIVTITARSKENATKKIEAKLTILGADEQGRFENVFEAENATIVAAEGSGIKAESNSDDRISGSSLVGNLSDGDRIIWGVNSDADNADSVLKIRMMGPAGWLGNWDNIPFTFADFFTVKVNGKIVNTEDIHVEGTNLKGSSADYFNLSDITIGTIALKKGLNTITLVVSNRFNQHTIDDGTYNGTLSCLGNIDNITVLSKANLTAQEGTVSETAGADPDYASSSSKFEVEAANTRVYENKDTPKADLGTATYAEFKNGMSILYGLHFASAMKVKVTFRVAAPYKTAGQAVEAMDFNSLLKVDLDGKSMDTTGLTIKAFDNAAKDNMADVSTGWMNFAEGDTVMNIAFKGLEGYAYLGGLDSITLTYISGEVTTFLADEPVATVKYTYEAEADTTKLVNLGDLAAGATSVELKEPTKVQTDVYKNKLETSKVIYGIKADKDCYATVSLKVASPYINATTASEDVGLGNLGDLWVNGTIVSTPGTVKGTSELGKKDNFTDVVIETQIQLSAGMNRIAWEPYNYTDNTYEYYGAMDSMSLTTSATLEAYEVNMWSDRNTYMDDANSEPIYVTVDKTIGDTPDNCWVAVYKEDDPVEANQPGSLYYYYPTGVSSWSDGISYIGKACNIMTQHPNSTRPLISAETGGKYKIVIMANDSGNANSGYDVYDTIHISCWNDNGNYGGRVDGK